MNFTALMLRNEDGFSVNIEEVSQAELSKQEGEVLVKVAYSTLNYKDALALSNSSGIVRKWPMIAGIDCVGEVVEDSSGTFNKGQVVILNGYGAGENHWGGLSQYAKLKARWLVPLPSKLSAWDTMALGTAGYTAALCVQSILDHGITPEGGPILVSGATGGVGMTAIYLLSKMGYYVTALTSKVGETEFFKEIGATEVFDATAFYEQGKPLQKETWQAAIDVLGSHTLANICAQLQYGGVVAACGLAQGMDLPANVAPFILRGITLAGIDSVMAPMDKRIKAWDLLNEYMDSEFLQHKVQTLGLDQCVQISAKIMEGKIKGRYIVDVNK